MKLLDTSGGNTKLRKNNRDKAIRVAGLSLKPNDSLCPMRKTAECELPCLEAAGRGGMSNVSEGRQRKTDFYMQDRSGFLELLYNELHNFQKLCDRNGVEPYVRLNVLSDIQYELEANGAIPQNFPKLNLFDYTKIAKRLDRVPDNYQLMFSYSKAERYQPQVETALKTDRPISAVFYGGMPESFLGRPVVNGDNSDIVNLQQRGKIVGLKYKPPRGRDIDPLHSSFVIDANRIPAFSVG